MSEAHVFDLLPGYALESLDEADLLLVARHLPHCPACRAELATYLHTVDQLAQGGPLYNPPPELRAKVLQRVTAFSNAAADAAPVIPQAVEAAIPAAAPEGPGREGWLRGLFAPRWGMALGVLAMALILLLAASTLLLWQRVDQLQASLPASLAASGLASDARLIPLHGTSAAPQARGYLLAFKGDIYGTLTVENAPVLEAGRQYQIWLIQDGQRRSGGVFTVNRDGYGTLMITADRPLDSFQSFGITIEPAGGSRAPTGQKVLGSSS